MAVDWTETFGFQNFITLAGLVSGKRRSSPSPRISHVSPAGRCAARPEILSSYDRSVRLIVRRQGGRREEEEEEGGDEDDEDYDDDDDDDGDGDDGGDGERETRSGGTSKLAHRSRRTCLAIRT